VEEPKPPKEKKDKADKAKINEEANQ